MSIQDCGNENKGAAVRHARLEGALPADAPLSRRVIRDKSGTNHPGQGNNAIPRFPVQQTERVELVSFGKRGGGVRLHPLPNRTSAGYVAHVDWLAFTCRPQAGHGLTWLFDQVEHLTSLKITEQSAKGFNGYDHSAALGEFGRICWGGKFQRGTIHVDINGTGCSRLVGPRRLRSFQSQAVLFGLAFKDSDAWHCVGEAL